MRSGSIIRWLLLLFFIAFVVLATVFWIFSNRSAGPTISAPLSILMLGDSVAEGVGSVENSNSLQTYLVQELAPTNPEITIENKAVSGSKTEEVLNNQLPKLFKDRYRVVILIVGTNDITHLVGSSTFESNYQSIVERLNGKADYMLLANIPQFSNTPIVPAAIQTVADFRTKNYNNLIDNIANGYPSAHVFNFYNFSKDHLRTNQKLIATDGFHPNDDGYQLIAKELAKIITETVD